MVKFKLRYRLVSTSRGTRRSFKGRDAPPTPTTRYQLHLIYLQVTSRPAMVLSPYHHRPYRTPSSKPSQACSPRAASPSPLTSAATPGEGSPRTRVAEKLQDLDLRHVQARDDRNSDEPPRKRVKRQPVRRTPETDDSFEGASPMSASAGWPVRSTVSPSPMHEIGETPTAQPDDISVADHQINPSVLVYPTSSDRPDRWRMPTFHPSPSADRSQKHAQTPIYSDLTMDGRSDTLHRSISPGPARLSPNSLDFDRAAMSWQDDEITGHLIDDSSLDDDGEGINGIGFKPTPAIAYARQQKRRRQVSDWKAREARAARQKRLERRKGAATSERVGKTVVRFK